MNIESEEWTTASEAARLLKCSHQRIGQMVDDDCALDAIRPWPRVLLIRRQSLAEWLAGSRPVRIRLSDARNYVLKATATTLTLDTNINVVRDLVRDFIEDARPCWENLRKDLWALETASALHTADRARRRRPVPV